MLILIISDQGSAVTKAFDTLTTGLAFERPMDVVLVGTAPVSSILNAASNLASKIRLAKEMGLQKIHIFDTLSKDAEGRTSDQSTQHISVKTFRMLCDKHAAIVSF